MDLNKLYDKQAELDKHILEKHNIKMSKEELLDNTILALLVEVGELANTTRCFKHWSTKGMMGKEVVLDELADVWHFYLSIGNQVGCGIESFEKFKLIAKEQVKEITESAEELTVAFIELYEFGTNMRGEDSYESFGMMLYLVGLYLKFTDEEVEQAYLRKHEENYKRQREGY